jgi:hypothetical protein
MPPPNPVPAATETRRLQQAYLAVFGPELTRTSDQQLVWRDLESFCHAYRPCAEALRSGEYPENNLLYNEGRRAVWLRARGQLLAALAPDPVPLKISRRRKPTPNP